MTHRHPRIAVINKILIPMANKGYLVFNVSIRDNMRLRVAVNPTASERLTP